MKRRFPKIDTINMFRFRIAKDMNFDLLVYDNDNAVNPKRRIVCEKSLKSLRKFEARASRRDENFFVHGTEK